MRDDDNESDIPLFLKSPANTETSRRDVLRFLSAFGVALVVPSVAEAAGDSPDWGHIPHGNVIAKALREPKWRAKLVDSPKKTLNRAGIKLGRGVDVVVVEDSLARVHVVIPSLPGMRGPEQGIVADILTRFRTDQKFSDALIKNPRAVFEQWTGARLPAKLDVVVMIETPKQRVIQLPPLETEGLTTPAQVQAAWGGDGGGGGGWGGGGDTWSIEGTIESGQICNCWSEGSDFDSQAPNCCFEEPAETVGPDFG